MDNFTEIIPVSTFREFAGYQGPVEQPSTEGRLWRAAAFFAAGFLTGGLIACLLV